MATIRDIASMAGVSISTVSNVLNNKKYVSPATAEKVMKAVEALDFHLDATAQSMKSKRSMMIGVVLPSITRVFYPQVLAGMNEVATAAGYSIVLYNTDYSIDKERKYVHELARNKADCIVVASVASDEDSAYLTELASLHHGSKRIPVISLGRDMSDHSISSIAWDNKAGAQMAVQSMIDNGARRIVYLSSFSPRGGLQRYAGYCAALEASGIPLDPSLCIKSEGSAWAGFSTMNRLLNDGLSFDGVFAGSDQRANGAVKALMEHGRRIPRDVMVTGFDNIFASSLIQPPLTTINVPKHRLGRESVNLALKMLSGDEPADTFAAPQVILLPLQLLERASTNENLTTTWELEGW